MAPARPFIWLFGFVRPRAPRLGLVLLLSLAATGLGLAQPWLTKLVIDDGLLAGRMDLLAWFCGLLLALALLGAAVGALNRWHYLTLSGQILFALRESLFRHLQRLSPVFYARRAGGDLLARIDGDVAEIQRFAVDTVLAAVNAVLALCGALLLMLLLSPWLTLVAAVALPLQFLAVRLLRPRIERLARRVRERSGAVTAFLVERLALVKLAQAMGTGDRETARLTTLHQSYLGDLRRLELAGFAGASIPGLLNGLSAAAVFLAGGAMVIDGRLTIGTLIAFIAYLGRAAGPVNTLLGLYIAQRRARVSLERVMELLREPPAVRDPERPLALPPGGRGNIRIEAVSFGFSEARPLLEGAEAIIPAGVKLGLAGASGIGKSTLVDLLQRHYDPQAGRILLDGIDLRHLRLAELRRRIAVVAQDTLLVPGTIADNIRYAAPLASDAEVARAAEQAGLTAGEAALEQRVGERGGGLSGGERQRLAIARALLQNPLVLILDEATAAVDRAAERRIAATVDRLFAGRTRIVVSHHPDALADADAVLELEAGRLVPRRGRLEPAA